MSLSLFLFVFSLLLSRLVWLIGFTSQLVICSSNQYSISSIVLGVVESWVAFRTTNWYQSIGFDLGFVLFRLVPLGYLDFCLVVIEYFRRCLKIPVKV